MESDPTAPHRSWVVVCKDPSRDPECDYSTIRAAYRALEYNFKNGERGYVGRIRTIRVKPGTYTLAEEGGSPHLGGFNGSIKGTAAQPLALVAYDPTNRPRIVGTCLSESNCPQAANSLRQTLVMGGEYWLLDGFQFERLSWGVFVDSDHVTVRNNRITDIVEFGVNVSQRITGYLLIEKNQIVSVGTSYLHHGVYVSLGQNTSILTSNEGCGESPLPKRKKENVTIRGNFFHRLTGSAVQLNAGDSNWSDHVGTGAFDGSRLPDTGIHGTVIENNVILDTAYGINLYRYAFLTRIVNNTFISTTDGRFRSSGQFIQFRNSAFNIVANNLFYSNVPSKAAIVGYSECGKDPKNDLNVVNYNLWCMPSDSRFSWNKPGSGVVADRAFSTFQSTTGQEAQGRIGTTGSGFCADLNFNANTYLLPDSRQLVVSNQGVEILPAGSATYVDFNKNGRRDGGDGAFEICPAVDFAGRTRSGSGCDIGAHEYDGGGSPPDPGSGGGTDPGSGGGGGTDPGSGGGGGTDPGSGGGTDPSGSPVSPPENLPEGAVVWTLQEGYSGYQGTRDTHIQQDDPNANFGGEAIAGAIGDWPPGSGRDDHALVMWSNLPGPEGKQVVAAEVWFYVTVPTAPPGFQLYRLKRTWDERTVSWNAPWSVPGASGTDDREATPLGTAAATTVGWHRVVLNEAGRATVQAWLDQPSSNHGLLLANGENADDIIYRTREYGDGKRSPVLVIALADAPTDPGGGGGTDPGGGGGTDPGSGGGTDPGGGGGTDPGSGGGGTDPGTGGLTPIDPSSSPVPLPQGLPDGAQIYALQQGLSGYQSASDSHIQEDDPDTNFGGDSFAGSIGDWPPGSNRDDHALLRWSVLPEPSSKQVLQAEIWLYVTVPTKAPGYQLYALKKDWSESTVTWKTPWQKPGAAGPTDRDTAPLGTATATEVGWHRIVLNQAGRAVVQGWIDHPDANFGLVLANGDNPDDIIFWTSNYADRALRPVLLVALGEVEDPPAQQVVSGLDVAEFQQGRDGYMGASDTFISQGDPTRVNGAGFTVVADGDSPYGTGMDDRILLRWNDLNIPVGSQVEKAEIWLYVTDPTSSAGYHVYEMLRSWSEATTTWETPWAGPGGSAPSDRGTAVLGTVAPSVSGWHVLTLNESGLEVIQRWVDAPISNQGLMLANSTNDNALGFVASDHIEVNRRPLLSVSFRRKTSIDPTDPQIRTVVFQDGQSGYDGTEDTELSEYRPGEINGARSFLAADGDAPYQTGLDERILVKWTNLNLPAASEVVGAQIWFYVSDPTNKPGYQLYGVKRSWTQGSATWEKSWSEPGAWGVDDRDTTSVARFLPRDTGWHRIDLNEAGIALVQSWIQNPASNQGILVAHPDNANSIKIYASENTTQSSRPMLLVQYRELAEPLLAMNKQAASLASAASIQVATAVEEDGIPREYVLHQNYPNPFNAATTIRYGLPEDTDVTLGLYDLLGRRLRTLIQGRQRAGTHTVHLEASALPSGVYFYVLSYNGTGLARKMVLVK